ncbi:hypothetical protein PHYPSEUDO_011543 [Phytophthora pseudosyringae]|uniref:Uncharacterized protein n=1 Tax=Phytophthora pseudosyringae TaxID=221518 RepID=A0A8T1VBK3_9STRA|nr:hypothetical protein PHYPSEUDO_011543 [Phytophthora pseudosyringae]
MAQPQLSDERFETANGDTCCVIFQTIQLPGVKSPQQVYDALLFSVNNAEISISERLGHVTVRDDYEGVDGNIFNNSSSSTQSMTMIPHISPLNDSLPFQTFERTRVYVLQW